MSATVESVLLTILTEQSELANKHIALLKTLPSLQNVNILPQPVAQQMMHHLTSTSSSSGGGFLSNSNIPKPLKVGEFLGMSDTNHQNAGTSSPGSAPVNKAGKPKKEKDPNKPKKAPSAYLVFMQDKQASVREQNKSLNQRELMQEMGRLWASLPETEKQRYGQTAEEEKNKYYSNMTAYNATRGLPPPLGAQKKEAKENAAAAAATATIAAGTSSSSAAVTVSGDDPASFSPLPLSLQKQPSVKKATAAAMVPIPVNGGTNAYALEASVTAILGDQTLLPTSSNSLGISAEDAEKKKKKKEKRKNEEGGNDDESEKKVKYCLGHPSSYYWNHLLSP